MRAEGRYRRQQIEQRIVLYVSKEQHDGAGGIQQRSDPQLGNGAQIETGTIYMNRCDYLDPALCWTGCKDTGRGASLSVLGYHSVTRPKSYHLKKA